MAEPELERKIWMGVLAKAPLELLEHQLEQAIAVESRPTYTFLRSPETGLTMVRGRAGGTGQPFNLGEMTITRCVIQLKAEGALKAEGELKAEGRRQKAEGALKAEGRRQKAEDTLLQTFKPPNLQTSKLPHSPTPPLPHSPTPITGFGYVAGRSHRHAELAAFCDALMQHPDWRVIVQAQVIEPLQAAAAEQRSTEAAEVESTRVNFFTMLRGESG
ncbi:MAG: phosphonate C-P lyase system protein PhnG [Cyanothece sp. SIO2G6]|nr:phosphonate C-P lyase system protein PhnG [Cyanothece sp. SIO2G6]